jgi:hypothetical protein
MRRGSAYGKKLDPTLCSSHTPLYRFQIPLACRTIASITLSHTLNRFVLLLYSKTGGRRTELFHSAKSASRWAV